jgi:hypothetical protein
VGYGARQTEAAGEAGAAPTEPAEPRGLSEGKLKLRRRALAVIEDDAPGVSPAAKLDAVELALEARVLADHEVAAARAWRKSRPH